MDDNNCEFIKADGTRCRVHKDAKAKCEGQTQPQPKADITQRELAAIEQEKTRLARSVYQAQQDMLTLITFSQENAEMVANTVLELNSLVENEGSFFEGAHKKFLDMGGGSKKSFLDWR